MSYSEMNHHVETINPDVIMRENFEEHVSGQDLADSVDAHVRNLEIGSYHPNEGSNNHGHCINRVALQWFEQGREYAEGRRRANLINVSRDQN